MKIGKNRLSAWRAIQKELDILYREMDTTAMTVQEYRKREKPLRERQSLYRTK